MGVGVVGSGCVDGGYDLVVGPVLPVGFAVVVGVDGAVVVAGIAKGRWGDWGAAEDVWWWGGHCYGCCY